MEYKKFKLEDIFYKVKIDALPFKVGDLPSQPQGEFNLPAVTAGVLNHGISCYVPKSMSTIVSNAISVSANGANSGVAFYQPQEFTILQDSYALKFKGTELNRYHYLYLTAILNKSFEKYNWDNKAGWNRVKVVSILLPVNDEGDINLKYMENYIKDIELRCLNKIKKYIKMI